jgi:CubicO group peptidase (beta-lactamase class C family)
VVSIPPDPEELVAARGVTAQLCVLQHGRVVLDRSFGCAPDGLFWTFSASKPFIALLVHLLAERGALRLDDPVARYWPAFGARGKAEVTVRQVLQHRSGLAAARGTVGDALAMPDWDRSIRNLERARLRWPPGSAPAYQMIVYGFILGEIVRRVTGVPPADLLRTAFLEPLGLRDTFLGVPVAGAARSVPVRSPGAGWFLNRPAVRRAVIPSAGVSATARDLARFYQCLLDGGGGVIAERTLLEARRPSTADGEIDRVVGSPIRWAQGFVLGGRSMGQTASADTYGHAGSKCCVAWAEPARGLVFAYLTDRPARAPEAGRHLGEVADAVRAAC